ncbi:cytochrome P450 [Dactylosporangium sp. CS-047395]|uniref:cytochrome P450 n=1 Tax=Dactylosporangium sp. CS-047395 TaxID=3239936 RepID=UPI003D8C035A
MTDPVPPGAAPVAWNPTLRRFVVSGHAEVVAVLQDPATYSSAVAPPVPPADQPLLADFAAWSARWLFFLDPPEHTTRRAPVARALNPRSVGFLAEPVLELARSLAADLRGPQFDLLADFAHPLAARVVAGLLVAPGPPTEAFLARARVLEHADAYARDPAARRAGLEAIAAATAALRSSVDEAPVPAALRAVWGDSDWVRAHSLMLVFAGVETTQNLIVNTLHALLTRGLWGPSLPVAGAVEEGARLVPPVLGVLRRTTRAVVLGGVALPEGADLVAMTAAANRDQVRFADPDRFDASRSPNPHLSYGLGRHYCPGAELTRLTARAALTALLDALPQLELAEDDPPWRDHDPIIHAPKRLLGRLPHGAARV